MSITTAIERIQNSVEDIKNSIENKGIRVPAGSKVDDLADLVDQINTVHNQDKTVDSSTGIQSVTYDAGYTGLGSVIINPPIFQDKTVDPSTGTVIVRPGDSDELEAIVSDGNVVFNTGIYISPYNNWRYKIEVKYYWDSSNDSGCITGFTGVYNCDTGVKYYNYNPTAPAPGKHLTLTYRENNFEGLFEPESGIHIATIECIALGDASTGKVRYTYDGISKEVTEDTTSDTNGSYFGLFAEYYNTSLTSMYRYVCPAGTRIYYLKIWRNDVLICDFEPAYTSVNNKYCFRDVINNKYIYATEGTPSGYYKPYAGLSSVTINPVTASIDSDIKATNIRRGVNILGVTGTYDGTTINNQNKSVNPSTSSQSITCDSGYTGLGTVIVNPVTASIDPDIVAGNIKKNVTILGVTGTHEGTTINNQNKSIDASTNAQTLTYDSGYTGLGTVTINGLDLDACYNLAASI